MLAAGRHKSDQSELGVAYADLRRRGTDELEAGRLEEALGLFGSALEIAEKIGDTELVDQALCNHAAILITLGRGEGELQGLREILLRSVTQEVGFSAAYLLARACEVKKSHKKSLFYAQVARDKALASGENDLIAKSRNQIGRALVAESHFARAVIEFEKALALLPEELSVVRLAVMVNMAYPKIILGEVREGFRLLFSALRWYRRSGKRLYEPWPHICLCYAYGEIGRSRRAWSHGRRGLEIAERTGDRETIRTRHRSYGGKIPEPFAALSGHAADDRAE